MPDIQREHEADQQHYVCPKPHAAYPSPATSALDDFQQQRATEQTAFLPPSVYPYSQLNIGPYLDLPDHCSDTSMSLNTGQAGHAASSPPTSSSASGDAWRISTVQDLIVNELQQIDLSKLALTCREGYQAVARRRWRWVVFGRCFGWSLGPISSASELGHSEWYCFRVRRMHQYDVQHASFEWGDDCLVAPRTLPTAAAPRIREVRLYALPDRGITIEEILQLAPNIHVISDADSTWSRAAVSGQRHRLDFRLAFGRGTAFYAEERDRLTRILGVFKCEWFLHFGSPTDLIPKWTVSTLFLGADGTSGAVSVADGHIVELHVQLAEANGLVRDISAETRRLAEVKRLCDHLRVGGPNDEPRVDHLHFAVKTDERCRIMTVHEYLAALQTSARVTLFVDVTLPSPLESEFDLPSLDELLLGPHTTWRSTVYKAPEFDLAVQVIFTARPATSSPHVKTHISIELRILLGMRAVNIGISHILDMLDGSEPILGSLLDVRDDLEHWATEFIRWIPMDVELELVPFHLDGDLLDGFESWWDVLARALVQGNHNSVTIPAEEIRRRRA